jgi:hypothetical protein
MVPAFALLQKRSGDDRRSDEPASPVVSRLS